MAEEQISVVLKANIDNYNKNMSIAAGVLKDLQKQSTEFMKINHGVEDSFTKIDFAAKKFGETAGVLEKKLVVVKKAMTDLVVAGQQNTKAFKDLDNQYKIITNRLENKAMAEAQAYAQSNMTNMALPKTAKGLDQASVSLKKNNMQMTNLALVLQDLPYGFRGIQNNLPALVGGMAGMTGGIYLAASAVIAFFTAWDNGMFGSTKSTNEWRKSLKETNDEIRNTLNYSSSEISNLQGLVDVMLDLNTTESIRNKALEEAREAITKVDEAQGKKIKTIGDAIIAINLYSEAIQQQQMQEVVGKKIAEISIGQIEKRNRLAIETAKANKGIHPIDFFMGNTELDNLNSEIIANETLLRQLEDLRKGTAKAQLINPYSPFNAKKGKGGKTSEELAKERARLMKIANDAETKAYIDTLDERGQKEYNAGLELAENLEKMKAAGYTDSITYYAAYRQKILDIAKYYDDKEIKEQERINNEKAAADKVIADRNLQNSLDALKIESDVAMKIANATGKTTATDRVAILENYKNNLYDLASVGGYTAEQFDKIEDALIRVDAAIDGSQDKVKNFTITWTDTINNINSVIMDFINNSMYALGESIGKALAGENIDVINVFGTLLADALTQIGKQLIAFATASLFAWALLTSNNPITAAAALVAGIAAVAAGSYLKSRLEQDRAPKKFANGGIVSGPTMGLIGEYPGAKSNPEVVAPLDKLKNMLGGQGGGSFVLRGSDLVLALNRSETSLNLRRGS